MAGDRDETIISAAIGIFENQVFIMLSLAALLKGSGWASSSSWRKFIENLEEHARDVAQRAESLRETVECEEM